MLSFLYSLNVTSWIALLPAILGSGLLLASQHTLRKTSVGRDFLALLVVVISGSLGYFLLLRSTSEEEALFWIRYGLPCLLVLPSLCYLLNAAILKPSGVPIRIKSFFLAIASLLVVAHFATNCFVRGLYHYSWGYFPRFRYPMLIFGACCLLLIALILKDAFTNYRNAPPGPLKARNRLLVSAWAFFFFGLTDLLPGFGIPMLPISGLPLSYYILASSLLFSRYGLTDFFQYLGLSSILRFSREPIFLISMDGKLRNLNLETARTMGHKSIDRLIGLPINTLFSPETPLFTKARIEVLKQHLNLPPSELDLVVPSGEMIPVRTAISGVFNRRNEMLGLVAIGRDIRDERSKRRQLMQINRSFREKIREVEERTKEITEANKALEDSRTAMLNILEDMEESHTQLEEAYRRLSELDRAKDVFLSSVSHELRTPLTSIRSFSEILLQYPMEQKETQREFLQIIHQESERLTRLVNDLLDIAKIESGKMRWKQERVHVRELFDLAVQTFSVLAKEKRLTVRYNVPDGLPELCVDRDRIYQVICNLLTNSMKFTPSDGVILLSAGIMENQPQGTPDTPGILIQVRDNGIGIPEEDIEMIFEKFHQGRDNTGTKPKGTGLGLAICKEIVEYYGGNIWAENNPDGGCCLSFTLPLAPRAPQVG